MKKFAQDKTTLLVVLGPTASGKTSLAVKLAKHFTGEIISADSRQVFRGLDIGSGKDLHEYGNVPYHLIDIVEPSYDFSVFEFQKRFFEAFSKTQKNKHLPLLVGGTGLYLDAILNKYQFTEAPHNDKLRQELANQDIETLTAHLKSLNPKLHNTTDLLDKERLLRAIEIAEATQTSKHAADDFPEIKPLVLGIKWDRTFLRKRIYTRLKQRLEEGMIAEVENLHAQGISWERFHYFGLEYRFVASYLQGEFNLNDMFQKLNSSICAFAKQQEKWFRRMERKGTTIHWIDGEKDTFEEVLTLLSGA